MIKDVKFKEESREGIREGVNILGDAVKITLGARGMLVFCTNHLGEPFATKDGVTVADDMNLPDGLQQMTCRFMKQGTRKTQDEAGDGTTTATVLAQALINNGFDMIDEGFNPVLLKRGIDIALEDALRELDNLAIPVSGKKHLVDVANISSNGDDKVAKLVSSAYEKVGANGIVTHKESATNFSHLQYTEGAVFEGGYSSHYFANDADTGYAIYKDCVVVIIDAKIDSNKQLLKFLPVVSELHPNKNIVVIAHKIASEAMTSMLINHRKHDTVQLCPIDSPKFGFDRLDFLEDIAALVGATVISSKNGFGLDELRKLYDEYLVDKEYYDENPDSTDEPKLPDHLFGVISGITAKPEETIIEVDRKDSDAIKERVKEIERLIEQSDTKEEEKALRERLARFESGLATIFVGASTPGEADELSDRIDDSVNAVKAALDEGIVEGGGVALMRVKRRLNSMYRKKNFSSADERIGYNVLIDSLASPLEAIVENGGGSPERVADKVYRSRNKGYNVLTGEYVNMYEEGIIDPKKVTRCALKNAVSIGGTLIGVGCSLVDMGSKILDPEKISNLKTNIR